MGQLFVDVPPPERWQDFERLVQAVCAREWDNPDVERFGRPGQAQHGIDVVGQDLTRDHFWRIGVQCKRRSATQADGSVEAGGLLSIADVRKEVRKTAKLDPPLSQFVIATTAAQDSVLQAQVAALSRNRQKAGRPPVQIWFWEWFVERLNRHPELLYTFYDEALKTGGLYDLDRHIVALLRMGFDRPFMRTPFHIENSVGGVANAIVRLQQLVATGVLKDADGVVIGQTPPARQLRSQANRDVVGKVEASLQGLRDGLTAAMAVGAIEDREFFLEIRGRHIADRLNEQRGAILRVLNSLLQEHGVEPIESPLLTAVL